MGDQVEYFEEYDREGNVLEQNHGDYRGPHIEKKVQGFCDPPDAPWTPGSKKLTGVARRNQNRVVLEPIKKRKVGEDGEEEVERVQDHSHSTTERVECPNVDDLVQELGERKANLQKYFAAHEEERAHLAEGLKPPEPLPTEYDQPILPFVMGQKSVVVNERTRKMFLHEPEKIGKKTRAYQGRQKQQLLAVLRGEKKPRDFYEPPEEEDNREKVLTLEELRIEAAKKKRAARQKRMDKMMKERRDKEKRIDNMAHKQVEKRFLRKDEGLELAALENRDARTFDESETFAMERLRIRYKNEKDMARDDAKSAIRKEEAHKAMEAMLKKRAKAQEEFKGFKGAKWQEDARKAYRRAMRVWYKIVDMFGERSRKEYRRSIKIWRVQHGLDEKNIRYTLRRKYPVLAKHNIVARYKKNVKKKETMVFDDGQVANAKPPSRLMVALDGAMVFGKALMACSGELAQRGVKAAREASNGKVAAELATEETKANAEEAKRVEEEAKKKEEEPRKRVHEGKGGAARTARDPSKRRFTFTVDPRRGSILPSGGLPGLSSPLGKGLLAGLTGSPKTHPETPTPSSQIEGEDAEAGSPQPNATATTPVAPAKVAPQPMLEEVGEEEELTDSDEDDDNETSGAVYHTGR